MNATLEAPSRAQSTRLSKTTNVRSLVHDVRPSVVLRASTAFLLIGVLETVAVLIAYFAAPV